MSRITLIEKATRHFLKRGVQIYTLSDYSPDFRLAALVDDQVLIYEVNTNPNAEYGEDLLDISDRVKYVGINSKEDGISEVGAIRQPDQIAKLVDIVLKSPVIQPQEGFNLGCFVVFHLNDGTSVRRAFDLDSGIMYPSLQVPIEFSDAIRQALL